MKGRIEIVFNNFAALAAALPVETHLAVMKTAYAIEADAKLSMKGGGSPHKASAPGTPPNIDTSNLVNSIHTETIGELSAIVAVNADYGMFLEYGTSKMAARPFLFPAVKRNTQRFIDDCKRMLSSWSARQ